MILYISANIEHNILEVELEGNINFLELMNLLDTEIDDRFKLVLLRFSTVPIPLTGKEYSEDVQRYMMENNLNVDDIPYLLDSYDLKDQQFKEVFRTMSVTNVESIILLNFEIPFNLLIFLLETDVLEMHYKIKLLIINLNRFSIIQAKKCFEVLRMPEFEELFIGKRPKIKKDDETEELLRILESKGWICRYNVDSRENDNFRVYGKRVVGF